VDAVTHKTCAPHERRNQVSQWQQENTAQHLSVVEHAYRSDKPNAQSHRERQPK
jgi:hypothetical protein